GLQINWVLGFSCIDGFSFVTGEPDIAKMFHRVLTERVQRDVAYGRCSLKKGRAVFRSRLYLPRSRRLFSTANRLRLLAKDRRENVGIQGVRSMRYELKLGKIAAIVLILAGLSFPAAAQGVGAIGGIVTDSSGGALPGVTVALSSAGGVIGGAQETVTDARGAYQFTRLIPGTYRVRASVTGFRASTQEGIAVNADVTARVDVRLEIGALEENITVSGQAPALDTTTALKQTVMTRETIDSLPARSNVWSIARNVPAVRM